jgi:uncharacterized protein YecE (DUF72 family)
MVRAASGSNERSGGADTGSVARASGSRDGRNAPRTWIGTSGWHYDSWWGPFYPEGLRKKDGFGYYVSRFATTELNAPFYRTPSLDAVRSWAEQAPEGFVFAWKASKYITHWNRLTEGSANGLRLIEERLDILGDKAGPVLFQLPPKMTINRERLAAFFRMLSPRRRYTFEFRHPSWYEPAILDLLREHNASLCLSDHAAAPAPWEATASFVYVRGHGPSGRYWGTYSDETLATWAEDIRRWSDEGREVYCYFDNDIKSAAPADAQRLMALVEAEQPRASAPPLKPPPARRARGPGRPGGSSPPGPDTRVWSRSRGSSAR